MMSLFLEGVHPESQVDNELEPGGSGNVAGELYPEDVDDTATAIKMEEVDDPNYPQGQCPNHSIVLTEGNVEAQPITVSKMYHDFIYL